MIRSAAPFRLALFPFLLGLTCPAAADALLLRRADGLVPLPVEGRPTFLEADWIEGEMERFVEARGRVRASGPQGKIGADWMRYDQAEDILHAIGTVSLERDQFRLEGEDLRLKLTAHLGEMRAVRYTIASERVRETHSERVVFAAAVAPDRRLRGRGQADRLLLEGEDRYRLDQASYTACASDQDDWFVKARVLELDYTRNLGAARDVRLEFLDTPILYAPWLDFALDNRRKTGFLTPSVGIADARGLELIVPWYWNIAPNRDATLTPRLMSKRGVQLAGEFRYLEPAYRGNVAVEWLPEDRARGESRYRGVLHHQHRFGPRLSARLNLEGVSDDRYFTELSSQVSETARVNLPREAALHYTGEGWQAMARVQSFQTLQEAAYNPDIVPYRRVPQITLDANRHLPYGLSLSLASELVDFRIDRADRPAGRRFHFAPAVSLPMQGASAYVTPRLGWNYLRYDLDRNPDPFNPNVARATSLDRSLPTFSLDSGLFLERDFAWRDTPYLQTLEPRLFYVYIPYRDQSPFPVFDTGPADLSLSQLFSENQYVGVDRLNDANQLTLAATTRWLETDSGVERLQLTLGQRYYFSDQRVRLPEETGRRNNVTDLIAQISGQITAHWRVTSGVQFNPDDDALARAHFNAQYRPGPARVLNAGLRYISDRYTANQGVHQFDLSWQWPLARAWSGLGRINYSVKDTRLVEGLLGFEYNAGCWSLRGVAQQIATTAAEKNTAFYLQLELRGLTRLGPDPLALLRNSIPGYVKTDELEP